MKNEFIIKELKKEIQELKNKGYTNLYFNCDTDCGKDFGKYLISLMVKISNNDGGGIGSNFSKSYQDIQFKSKNGALKLIDLIKLEFTNIKIYNFLK